MFKAVSNRWTGLLEWTTGMDFDPFFLVNALSRRLGEKPEVV